ncbi:MAG: biotin-dependent carboxyltransferase family protein [Hyphomicrobiaceae bacterium]|nr:biotin-dependent carboxyltransferase family protein [Hyphomicrobiaceae bacterium]
MSRALQILSPGLLTTIQDMGRPGYQRLGIPVSGALDPVSFTAANLLVGNPPGTAALEIAYQGPTIRIAAESVRMAYAGGGATIEALHAESGAAERIPVLQSRRLVKGQSLRIGALSGSTVGYLAIEGGFDVPPFLSSLSTYTRGGFGGWRGRALAAGDALLLQRSSVDEHDESMLPPLDLKLPRRFRVVLGPQDDHFTERGVRTFLESEYTVTPASDRMGMRLEGPQLEHADGYNIVSDGIAPGSIQVPGNGLPIILLADRQTTGGYPKLATVISTDLAALGRLAPGARLAFEAVGIEQAEDLRIAFAAELASLADKIRPAGRVAAFDETKLMSANLVSGVVHACEPEQRSQAI